MAKKVLIVDDEEDVRFLIQTLLKRHKYEAETAEDGEAGLEKMRETSFDLVILDILMPKLDGYGVLRKMAEAGLKTPVIMLTARADDDSVWDGYSRGATLYVTKPFDNKYLIDAVNYLIGDLSEAERREIERRL